MKNKNLLVLAVAAGVISALYVGLKKPITYSGQCGPLLFDYSKLTFSITGSVTSIEKQGQKINVSNVPCIYQEEK